MYSIWYILKDLINIEFRKLKKKPFFFVVNNADFSE